MFVASCDVAATGRVQCSALFFRQGILTYAGFAAACNAVARLSSRSFHIHCVTGDDIRLGSVFLTL